MPLVAGTAYATRTDLANIGLIGAALTALPTGQQDAALLAASGLCDSYFSTGGLDVPLPNWGSDVVRAVAIIAAYDLMTARGYNPASGADQNIRQRYLDVLAWLQAIAEGITGIVVPPGSTAPVEIGADISSSEIRGFTPRGDDSIGDVQ